MSKTSYKLSSASDVKRRKTKDASLSPPDDDTDAPELDEYMVYSLEDERVSKKMAARRKIDIYMEKKRLREELIDLEDENYDY